MTETAALFLAFAFGVMFNWLIVRWGKSGYGDGFTALWVVIGVFVDAGDFQPRASRRRACNSTGTATW